LFRTVTGEHTSFWSCMYCWRVTNLGEIWAITTFQRLLESKLSQVIGSTCTTRQGAGGGQVPFRLQTPRLVGLGSGLETQPKTCPYRRSTYRPPAGGSKEAQRWSPGQQARDVAWVSHFTSHPVWAVVPRIQHMKHDSTKNSQRIVLFKGAINHWEVNKCVFVSAISKIFETILWQIPYFYLFASRWLIAPLNWMRHCTIPFTVITVM